MIRRPPRSTRTDTLFPYTTLFRSHVGHADDVAAPAPIELRLGTGRELRAFHHHVGAGAAQRQPEFPPGRFQRVAQPRSEEHTSELQSLMRISYAVFCLKKKTNKTDTCYKHNTPKRTKQTNST